MSYKTIYFFRNIICILLAVSFGRTFGQSWPVAYVLQNVHLIDVETQQLVPNSAVWIREGKIIDIRHEELHLGGDSVVVIDCGGRFLMPGLIDAHVHLATDPTVESRAETERVLKEMLHSGITAVRDMAGDARTLASLSRDALVGAIDAPNVYYSALMAGAEFFNDPRTQSSTLGGISGEMPYMKAIVDTTQLALAVAEAKGTGAKGIKLYTNLDSITVRSILKEANNQQFPVWSHAALFPAKPSEIARSGVISVSHAVMWVYEKYTDRQQIPTGWKEHDLQKTRQDYWEVEYRKLDLKSLYEEVRKNDVVLDATLSAFEELKDEPGYTWMYEMNNRITREANRAGVKVAAGCDTDQATFVQYEMKLLVKECGFTPMEALRAATRNSAQATGILDSQGTIAIGKQANLLLLNENPVESIDNIEDVYLVIKNGKIY